MGRYDVLMATTVYFIRHAKSDFSVKDDRSRPLTAKGHEAAMDLVTRFSAIHFDAIYSSPYTRTIDTVKPLASSKGLMIIPKEDFRERRIGKWVADFPSYAQAQWADFDFKINGGESLRTVQQRNIKQLSELLVSHKGHTLLIGTHGTALSTIINYYDSTFDFDSFAARQHSRR
jgi:2,3-bisphosphoglycerate-dependent phosphoglycerate mutase